MREAIREKLQRERDRAGVKSTLVKKLLAGLESGKPIAFTAGYFDARKQSLVRARRMGRKNR
jgi:hypothetical protein